MSHYKLGFCLSRIMCHVANKEAGVLRKRGRIALIQIGEPDGHLTCRSVDSLVKHLSLFEADEESPVGILHGQSGSFCKGFDPKEVERNPITATYLERSGLLETYLTKPVVAAISGFAVGAGFDLALWCDFRIIEETAVLGGHARNYGLPVSRDKAERFVSLLGLHKTLDLILTGRYMKPKEAYECGIATRLVACGTGIGQAWSFANAIANMPNSCLKADKATIVGNSMKFNVKTKDKIIKEAKLWTTKGLEEFQTGEHITSTGDVRHKYNS